MHRRTSFYRKGHLDELVFFLVLLIRCSVRMKGLMECTVLSLVNEVPGSVVGADGRIAEPKKGKMLGSIISFLIAY